MFWICIAIVAIIIAIEQLLRWRDRKIARARTMRWLAFQINQEKKYGHEKLEEKMPEVPLDGSGS